MTGSQDEEGSVAGYNSGMEHIEQEGTVGSLPADHARDENHYYDEWNDAPPCFSTPRHHKRRGYNSARLLHSPSQHRRRVLRRYSSGESDVHVAVH